MICSVEDLPGKFLEKESERARVEARQPTWKLGSTPGRGGGDDLLDKGQE